MLRIKKEIDLKELEKFGFKKEKFFGYQLKEKYNDSWAKVIAEVQDDRTLFIELGKEEYILKLLANLVEKVSEGDNE